MIETLQDVISERGWSEHSGIVQIVDNIKNRLERRLPENVNFSLTALQKKALNHPMFWDRDDGEAHNLIVQGATSAGKTLLSEMNIIEALSREQQAIVLVPLKAMVRERTEQFKADIERSSLGYKVYGSSSDYQDNDERIINGEYDVAIIVYEKFFAMLSQQNSKILNRCSLIVVDELSMLSKDERGPKLEMALEIARALKPEVRIMCLATCDCQTNLIANWLDADENSIIKSTMRPVGLKEYIVLPDGQYKFRHIPGENETDSEEIRQEEGQIPVQGYRAEMREYERKKQLLLAVIKKVYAENQNAKVLVFVARQRDTSSIAEYLAQELKEIYPLSALNPEFSQKIEACDADEDQKKLSELLPYGIGYHNAGISTNLRELMEEEFQNKDTNIKTIVATETLTIGVNMPFDVMIMIDSSVPRGTGVEEPLSNQEYRNYIGRAGRLGQSNRCGASYLFVQNSREQSRYWVGYEKNNEEIKSALTNADEERQAPYYLSLLTNRAERQTTFTEETVKELYDKSLAKVCGGRLIDASKLQDHLYNNYLADRITQSARQRTASGAKMQCALTLLGKSLASYALSMETCLDIYWYFTKGDSEGGMPAGITREIIDSDQYLLDILYRICLHKEIDGSSVLLFPRGTKDVTAVYKAAIAIRKALIQILLPERTATGDNIELTESEKETVKERLWENSELATLLFETNLGDEDKKLQAAMRAILLYYWTCGKTIREIRDITGFSKFTKIINGDLERMAEVVSFHLEAIYRSLGGASVCSDAQAVSAVYSLSTRIKYGMPRDIVCIANKHIHGLDRSRILELRRATESTGLSPMQCLYVLSDDELSRFITPIQRNLFLQRMENRYSTSMFDNRIDMMQTDMGSEFTLEERDSLKSIADWDGSDCGELISAFKEILQSEVFDRFCALDREGARFFTWNHRSAPQKKFYIAILEGKEAITPELETEIDAFFANGKKNANSVNTCILIATSHEIAAKCHCHYDLAITNGFFALMLANAITLQENGANALAEFLTDTRGVFDQRDQQNFSLSNYIPMHKNEHAKFRILCDRSTRAYSAEVFDAIELQNAISSAEDMKDYEILTWGSSLSDLDLSECPTVIFLKRNRIVHSESQMRLLNRMRSIDFENCCVLFNNLDAAKEWNEEEQAMGNHELAWNHCYSKVRQLYAEDSRKAVEVIRDFVEHKTEHSYLIGISYAHYDSERVFHGENEYDNAQQISNWETDTEKLGRLAEELKNQFGEGNILYDQFYPARTLFYGTESQKKSLEAYRSCKLCLILDNVWTKENVACRAERQVIEESCAQGKAERWLLQSAHGYNPQPPEGEFTVSIDFHTEADVKALVQRIDEALRKILRRQ